MSVNGKGIESQGRSAVQYFAIGECDYCNENADCKAFCWYCKKTRKMCRDHLVPYLSTAYGIVAGEEGDMFVMRPCRCYDCETSIERKREAEEAVAKRKEAEAAEALKKKVTIEEAQPDRVAALEAKLDALISGLMKGKDKKENEQTL